MMDYQAAVHRIYASWLGKLIGIRLGAPIEGWTSEEIRRTYGSVPFYVTDYGQFAADDDANGPLFFSRVLRSRGLADLNAETMGNQLLDVVGERRGFFWWGGEGISTEQTAWENLNRGIHAPQSGSIAQNGQAIAEQIGGQIFSDCWGYLSLGDAEEAAHLAEMMSSVTHDGEGIEGGRFIAACIAHAWREHDIEIVIEKAAQCLNPGSRYHALIMKMVGFHAAHPQEPERCLEMIEREHGYSRYPGVCHILPNAAIILYGLLYGGGSFSLSMRLIAEAGCDTDCNLGNAGSILGMMLGLEGIEERWIEPFNDILLCSSAAGSQNITSISQTAEEMAAEACRIHGIPCPQRIPGRTAHDFALPHATAGFFLNADRYRQASLAAGNGHLDISLADVQKGQELLLSKKVYFRPQDVYDNRYEPQFSAIAEPGDLMEAEISEPVAGITVLPFARGYDGVICYGSPAMGSSVRMRLPSVPLPMLEAGLCLRAEKRIMRQCLKISRIAFTKMPDYCMDFSKLAKEDWGIGFDGRRSWGMAGLSCCCGSASLSPEGLILQNGAMVNFSGPECAPDSMDVCIEAEDGADLVIAWDWHGCMSWQGIRIMDGRMTYLHRDHEKFSERVLAEEKRIKLKCKCALHIDFIRVKIDLTGVGFRIHVPDCDLQRGYGALAFVNQGKPSCRIIRIQLASANENIRREKK